MSSYTRSLRIHPPSRAEHIGSLLRPRALKEKRELHLRSQVSQEELKLAEDDAVKEVVKLQQEAGMKSITDGEMRREVFYNGVFEKLEGMKLISTPLSEFMQYLPYVPAMRAMGRNELPSYFCDGKIKRRKSFYVDDFKYLKSLVSPEDVQFIKITMCTPTWMHHRHASTLPACYDKFVYENDDEYFNDIGAAYREEIKELYELGCRHVQIDNPTFSHFCIEDTISGLEKDGIDPEAVFDLYVRAINSCSKDRPHDLTFGVHICRGNWPGKEFPEGTYARISTKLFNDLDVDVFYLEYDTERAGDFMPLKDLPPNKMAVLGLITTKVAQLETVEELRARVDKAVDALCDGSTERSRKDALNQLCISTQCGFASGWRGNSVTEEDQRKKLSLLVEAANKIWNE